jgi:hypothetical protein
VPLGACASGHICGHPGGSLRCVPNDSGVTPGWYADPLRRFELRWFNGADWTADVANGENRFVDPQGTAVVHPVVDNAADHATSPTSKGSRKGGTDGGGNPAANAAMALGIVAVAISWLPFVVVLGFVAALLAIGFGTVGLRRAGPTGDGRGRAIAGIATGASAVVAATIGVALSIIVLDAYDDYLEPSPNEVAVNDCTIAGARATAQGTIENLGADDADFSVLVGFVRVGTDNPHRTARATLDDVAPGELREFEVQRQVDLDDVDCIVLEVNGPLPFGVQLD